MKSSSNAYRNTNHPDELHEFLNRAILDQMETRGITVNSELIPPNTLDLPEGEVIMRWSIIQEKSGRKTAVLATMKIRSGWLDLEIRDEEDGFSGNEIPPELANILDEN
jgi:hypothetical protein